MAAMRTGCRLVFRRFSTGGKVLSEEEKAAENVYIKVVHLFFSPSFFFPQFLFSLDLSILFIELLGLLNVHFLNFILSISSSGFILFYFCGFNFTCISKCVF